MSGSVSQLTLFIIVLVAAVHANYVSDSFRQPQLIQDPYLATRTSNFRKPVRKTGYGAEDPLQLPFRTDQKMKTPESYVPPKPPAYVGKGQHKSEYVPQAPKIDKTYPQQKIVVPKPVGKEYIEPKPLDIIAPLPLVKSPSAPGYAGKVAGSGVSTSDFVAVGDVSNNDLPPIQKTKPIVPDSHIDHRPALDIFRQPLPFGSGPGFIEEVRRGPTVGLNGPSFRFPNNVDGGLPKEVLARESEVFRSRSSHEQVGLPHEHTRHEQAGRFLNSGVLEERRLSDSLRNTDLPSTQIHTRREFSLDRQRLRDTDLNPHVLESHSQRRGLSDSIGSLPSGGVWDQRRRSPNLSRDVRKPDPVKMISKAKGDEDNRLRRYNSQLRRFQG